MSPQRGTEGLAAAARVRRAQLLDLGERIADRAAVGMPQAPVAGSAMIETESAIGASCLGEVVVTTCAVTVDGASGWGCALGWDRAGALAAALADAAGGAQAEELGRSALEAEEIARRAEDRRLAATRVVLG